MSEEVDPVLKQSVSDHVLCLRLNRPGKRNPLSHELITALHSAINEASNDDNVRVIVIASSGPVFSAGHNLKEMSATPEGETAQNHKRKILNACAAMMQSIVYSPKAVIASVQGTATAAGCQLVSACDLALAADTAQFCLPGVNIGAFCTTPLVGVGRNMHRKHAMEMALTGDMLSAEDAVRMGLLNRAVPAEALEEETMALACRIAQRSSQGIASGKSAFYQQIDMPLDQAFEFATEVMVNGFDSDDGREGVDAFLQKRAPKWRGL